MQDHPDNSVKLGLTSSNHLQGRLIFTRIAHTPMTAADAFTKHRIATAGGRHGPGRPPTVALAG
jgi:hypothetical protein